jgi:hypothetical protein
MAAPYPGWIPSSTEPPSIGSNGVRIETKREGALAESSCLSSKATTLALDKMCLLIETPMSLPDTGRLTLPDNTFGMCDTVRQLLGRSDRGNK